MSRTIKHDLDDRRFEKTALPPDEQRARQKRKRADELAQKRRYQEDEEDNDYN
jgi:hypothetical protein